MGARQVTLRIQPPVPLGDVTGCLSGRPEPDMAQAMAALADVEAWTAAEIFKHLRRSFPAAPLGARVAALGVIMERLCRSF